MSTGTRPACNPHEHEDEFLLPKVRSFSGVLSPLFVHTAAEKKLSRRAIFTTRFLKRIMPSHARLHPGRAVSVRTRTTRTPTRRELGTPTVRPRMADTETGRARHGQSSTSTIRLTRRSKHETSNSNRHHTTDQAS